MAIDGMTLLLERARDAFAHRDWIAARDGFNAARAHGTLTADDTFALGDAVWWLGSFRETLAYYEEAYHLYLEDGRPRPAAATAMGIAAFLFMRGDAAVGSGWMGRALRLLKDEPECVEHGYVLIMELESALGEGEYDAALDSARQMQAMGQRFGDPNLQALGLMGEGRGLINQGRVLDAIALLDEAMLAAVSDNLAPEWAGNIYCQMMRVCYELSD